jgi:hypothetical protein
MKLSKLKIKNSFVKGVELYGWYLNLKGMQFYTIKSWETIMSVIKRNWKSKDQIEIGQIPN